MVYEGDDAVNPSDDWIEAGWGEAWHPGDIDIWEYIGEVLNDFLDYMDDAGYL